MIDREITVSEFIGMSPRCIFVLINEEDKKFCLVSTDSIQHQLGYMIDEVSRLGRRYLYLKDDLKKLKFRILETDCNELYRYIYMMYWADHFTRLGYTSYNRINGGILRVDYDVHKNGIIQVYLTNSKFIIIVGLFDNLKEAQDYIRTCYYNDTNKYNLPVFANNRRTREFMCRSLVSQECLQRPASFKIQDKVKVRTDIRRRKLRGTKSKL